LRNATVQTLRLTSLSLVEEMAAIIHKYHPETRIYFTNQKFDNDDDKAIFNLFAGEAQGMAMGPGAMVRDRMQHLAAGHRQTHRMDLFPLTLVTVRMHLYPKELLHQLPPTQKLLYYNEITHWKYAQHAFVQMYPRPDKDGNHPPHWSHEFTKGVPISF